MKCPKCGYENPDGARSCSMCAEVLARKTPFVPNAPIHPDPEVVTCPGCGRAAKATLATCQLCGTTISGGPAAPAKSEKKRPANAGDLLAAAALAERGAPRATPIELPPDAGGGPFTLVVGGRSLAMPAACACCLGPPQGTFKVRGDKKVGNTRHTFSYEFPCCTKCSRHMSIDMLAMGISLVIAAAAVIAAFWQFGEHDLFKKLEGILGCLAVVGVLVGGLVLAMIVKGIFNLFIPAPEAPCVGRGDPVSLDVNGIEPPVLKLTFQNREFGRRVKAGNEV